MKKFLTLTLLSLCALAANAQAAEVEMADTMRANGKIYVVVGIILIVLFGFIAYLFMLDRKLSRLEKEFKK
jgi:CcmD family protein